MIATLRTLMRARAAEAEEAMIDANAPLLLAQHLRDAKAQAIQARKALARLMASDKAEQRRLTATQTDIARLEDQTRAALEANKPALAGQIADHILSLQDQCARISGNIGATAKRCAALRQDLAHNEARINGLEDQLKVARAAHLARSAGAAPSLNAAPCALDQAEKLAARMERHIAFEDDAHSAYGALSSHAPKAPLNEREALEASLKEAGIDDARALKRKALLARLGSPAPQ